MKLITLLTTVGLFSLGSSACNCVHNNDAGRWIDKNSPAAAAVPLINANGGCYTATGQGRMCVGLTNGNQAVKDCLGQVASNWQSYHSDWFLWTSITCDDGNAHAQLTIT
ncbi:hypothetical protein P153DRAFT_364978 [Dothidotthia symphoricarpi CBS 119687]|uniref:Cyanovirin-N domain-containing protein n=1 Tax=Dothidotthia symphoricarpi CBS 119687 TaxID=1392245 RepID=A0A6A6AKI5_9PLEO|nr:uncharacterized protein P153DRAFT_364978 [Dothidotthia symphoricarpi CBS 119687]KAF2131387.1 hypothetical protein P153DRAFT_364978 [Dothidotthia symphoricarpi CBS 119687]